VSIYITYCIGETYVSVMPHSNIPNLLTLGLIILTVYRYTLQTDVYNTTKHIALHSWNNLPTKMDHQRSHMPIRTKNLVLHVLFQNDVGKPVPIELANEIYHSLHSL